MQQATVSGTLADKVYDALDSLANLRLITLMLKLMKLVSTRTKYGGPSAVLYLKNMAEGVCVTCRVSAAFAFAALASAFSDTSFSLLSFGLISRFACAYFTLLALCFLTLPMVLKEVVYSLECMNSGNVTQRQWTQW
jgi:hypothetical protein